MKSTLDRSRFYSKKTKKNVNRSGVVFEVDHDDGETIRFKPIFASVVDDYEANLYGKKRSLRFKYDFYESNIDYQMYYFMLPDCFYKRKDLVELLEFLTQELRSQISSGEIKKYDTKIWDGGDELVSKFFEKFDGELRNTHERI